MDGLTYHQVGRQRRREMMGEARQEHLANEARKDSGKRAGLPRYIGPGLEPRRFAGRVLKGLRTGKNED